MEIKEIIKRNGKTVPFEKEKIANAIFKAAVAVGGHNRKTSEILAGKVIKLAEKQFEGKTPTVEQIQDLIEKTLIEEGHAKTAKAFILYREQRAKIRDMKNVALDIQETISDYLEQSDWRVKENSNEQYSFSGLLLYTAGKVIANYMLNKIYTPDISEAHKKGYIHIHDLSHGVIGYCAGWSIKKLLERGFGGVPNKVEAKPAKHLGVVVHQMVNFIGCLQMEFAGAQAFSSVDTMLAPFIKTDNLSQKEVKQEMQKLIFSLNIPSRWGCFSEDTEILTDNGWRNGTELEVGDVIATFNTNTEEIEYLPVQKMTKDHYKGKMKRLKNRITDQLVTPNHRVLRRIHNFKEGISESKYVFEEANNLCTKIPLIPLGAKFNGTKMNKDTVNLLSWIVSEGSICENERIAIYQSPVANPQNCSEIRSTLETMEIPFDESSHVSGFTGRNDNLRFRLNRPVSRSICQQFFPGYKKIIPQALRNLSTDLAREFVETYMKADGNVEDSKIYTKKKEDADMLQELIAKCGWGSTLRTDKNGMLVIRVIRHDYTQVSAIEEVDYNGIVWCPTTSNGTVVARRKGKVFISGNSQYPFSNLTFDLVVPEDLKNEKAIVGGKEMDFTYGDCQKEIDMVNKGFIEVMLEGDAKGAIFTFPIPTYNLTKDFDWDSENANLLFEMTAKYGTPYFQNYIGSGLDPRSLRSMCCRLTMDMTQLIQRPGHTFAMGDATGSIGVVTLNLNRLGYESKNKEEFFAKIKYYMTLAKESLETKRKIINNNLKNGLMPYTRVYLGTFRNHFSTIGLCGMNEACLNMLGENILSKEGKKLTIETLTVMRELTRQFQIETGNLYNLEATPAEGASYRLAKLDKEIYPDIITAGKNVPYLTNSTQIPVNATDDVIEALEHQNDIQPLYTGGTVFHAFLGEKMSSGEAAKKLVKKIAYNTRIPYFTITPTFSICPEHGYVTGEHFNCPKAKETKAIEAMQA